MFFRKKELTQEEAHIKNSSLILKCIGSCSLFEIYCYQLSFFFRIETKLYSTAVKIIVGYTAPIDRKSTRLNSSHVSISYAVFCLKKKTQIKKAERQMKK